MSDSDGPKDGPDSRPQTSPEQHKRRSVALDVNRPASTGLAGAAAGFDNVLTGYESGMAGLQSLGGATKEGTASPGFDDPNMRPNTAATAMSMMSGVSTTAGGGMYPNSMLGEIEIAELETRVRRSTLELIQPSIKKTTQMESDLEGLREELRRSTSVISDLARVSIKVEEQVVVVEGFREEMTKWEAERRAVQAHVAETLSNMKLDLDTFRYSLERKDSSMHGMQRTMDRMVGELSKLQEGSEALRQHVELRLAQTGKILNGAKTDLECKLITLETKTNRLSDELWAEETGLARATGNITKTNDLVMNLSEEMKRMQHDKANMTQLEAVQDDANELIRDANCNVTMLKQTVDTMVNSVKEHFKTATTVVAAHNATMLSEVRASYQDELTHAAALRTEVMEFLEATKVNVARIESTVETGHERTSGIVNRVTDDIVDLTKSRKRDNADNSLAGQTMKEQISKVSASSESVQKCLEHFGSIIAVMLKSDRVASALAQQENVDRAKVALMGYRDTKEQKGRPSTSSKAGGKRPAKGGEGSESGEAVISVDNRCLSCSGQAQHVLSGFKMACLQYAPGPVSFSKKLYKQDELLELRQALLDQAQEQLAQGPAGSTLGDFKASSKSGNMQRDLEASMKRTAETEAMDDRPASQSSDGSVVKPRALPPLAAGGLDASRPMTAR